ncbi:MAG TPA: hypothetical protein VGW38_21765 [Chloroflexota bacterium]|nr:hypothetical protein [Chloroflexota bacterium]
MTDEHFGQRLRILLLERTRRLIALDDALRAIGEPGVLDRPSEELPGLERLILGSIVEADTRPTIEQMTPEARRQWLRCQLRVLPGGRDV